MEFDDPASMLRMCTERLGEQTGRQFAAMARRGFRLNRPTDDTRATGRCRLGGPALLEPGTPWPEAGGFSLSLFAVLDIGALAPWLGDELATRPGLLNFFYLDLDLPYEEYRKLYSSGKLDTSGPDVQRVLPADPARAVEMGAPAPAHSYPATPVHAAEAHMLPDSWDVESRDMDYDEGEYWGPTALLMAKMEDLDGNTMNRHCAFGWPDTSYATRVTDRDADGRADVHLLQLTEDGELGWGWGDAGTMYFTIPAKAFTAGDFSQTKARVICC